MSVPLMAVIAELKLTPVSVIPVLQTLHAESAAISTISKVDLKHLTSRSIGLLKKHDPHSIWCGVNIISVLIDNTVVLTSEGSVIFLSLLKVWTLAEGKIEAISRSIVECLNKLCKNIRGKPTLTREVLTPNLGPLITAYFDRIGECPSLIVPSLQTLILEHPTTSRPFGNKIKAKILEFIARELFMTYPEQLRFSMCSLLATLTVIEKDGPEKFWAQDVNRILSNISRALSVYSSFLSVSEDDETTRVLKELSELDSTEIFPSLHIDINEPTSILSISTRVALLFEILKGYLFLRTSFAVAVPLGKIISALDLSFSINPKFVPFKRELRDATAREYVQISLTKTQQAALGVLSALPTHFSTSLVPHLANVFASLELLIFLQKNRIDAEKVLANEEFSCAIIAATSHYLSLTAYLKDFSQINRIVDLALFLVEPRAAPASKQDAKANPSSHSKSAKKNAKKNGPVVLADLLSHEHLFRKNVPSATRDVVLQFFSTVIRKAPVAPTQYNKLIKFIVTEAVSLRGKSKYATIPNDIKDVLVSALLHPGANSASIYSLASSLVSSPLLSFVQNPRFPPLPITVKNVAQDLNEEETEDDFDEPITKRQKLVSSVTKFDDAQPVVQPAEMTQAPEHMIFKETKVEKVVTEEAKGIVKEEKTQTVETTEIIDEPVQLPEATVADEDDESDGGSEIEIPDLDMDSDSEAEA